MNYSIFFKKNKSKRGFTRTPKFWVSGFTLTELVVVMTIATVVMTSVVIQQSKWNDQLVVSTQAYEMALVIRQAQIYALGVRGDPTGIGDKFNIGYGVYFSSENADAFKRYIFFKDINNNGMYDSGEQIQEESKILTRDVIIDRFCGIKGTNSDRCSPGIGNVAFLHIVFFRPEPKANIIMRNSGGGPALNVNPPAKIFLKSPQGKYYYVQVEENGQISTGEGGST